MSGSPPRRTAPWAIPVVAVMAVVVVTATVWVLLGPDGTTPDTDPYATATAPTPTAAVTPHTTETDGVTVHWDRPYVERDDGPLRMDVFVPAADVPSPTGVVGRRPTAVMVHGGGWYAGERTQYVPLATALAEAGWVAIPISYRLAPDHPYPAPNEDVAEALRHVVRHAAELQVDPDRIVLIGDSAGASLATQVALRADESDQVPRVAGVVAFSGVYDLGFVVEQALEADDPWLPDTIAAHLGCPDDTDPVVCAADRPAASPRTHVSADDPPMLLLHSVDEFVPVADARAQAAALQDAGIRGDLVEVPGEDHGLQLGPATLQVVFHWLVEVTDVTPIDADDTASRTSSASPDPDPS